MHPAPWVLPHRDARRIGLVTVCLCRRAGARENRGRSGPADAGVGGLSQRRGASRFHTRRNSAGAVPSGVWSCPKAFPFAWRFQRNRSLRLLLRRSTPSKRRGFAAGCIRNRSVPPVARLHRIFGSHGLVPRERTLRVFQCCHSHNHWLNRRFFPFLSKLSLLPAKVFSVLLMTRACACRLSRSRQKRPGYPQSPYLAVDNLAYLVDGLGKARH